MRKSQIVLISIVVFAVLEVALIMGVASQIGIGWTIALLLGTAALGTWLWRREGGRAFEKLAGLREHPEEATTRLSDASLVMVGGVLLLLPGFLTDLLGLACLIPASRPMVRRGVAAALAPATRKLRDQIDLTQAQLRPDTVIRGETVDDRVPPRANDDVIIRGEVEK